jgi:hypothetical protein
MIKYIFQCGTVDCPIHAVEIYTEKEIINYIKFCPRCKKEMIRIWLINVKPVNINLLMGGAIEKNFGIKYIEYFFLVTEKE